jgi:hypothetical protein
VICQAGCYGRHLDHRDRDVGVNNVEETTCVIAGTKHLPINAMQLFAAAMIATEKIFN